MKKICIFVGSRANYSSVKSVMSAIQNRSDMTLQLIVGASAILDKYGSVIDLISRDGFTTLDIIDTVLENDTPSAMAKSTALGIIEMSNILGRIKPDVVVTVGDRFETMATVISASYMNIPIAHTMGGEITGTLDETIRHAITKFSNIHFPATKLSAERIIKMGEDPNMVFNVGCPRIDIVNDILSSNYQLSDNFYFEGAGCDIDVTKNFLLLSQHSVTTEYAMAENQMAETLFAIKNIGLPLIALWPNPDAGTDGISRALRKFREKETVQMRIYKNIYLNDYIWLENHVSCLIGNSSSGIREGSFIGTPVVNIGTRQQFRERGSNVIDVPYCSSDIARAIETQVEHGKYKRETLYGDGHAGIKIANILDRINLPNNQKRLTY